MPVARGPQISARSALVIGFSALVVAVLIGLMALWAASQDDTQIILGDRDFNAGKARVISDEISDRGPILYSDVGRNRQRDIIVTHIGDDPEQGWLAFAARRATDPRDCFFSWDSTTKRFFLTSSADSDRQCDDVTVDAQGSGLLQYPVELRNGNIHVLLNKPTQ